jgi:hypothetical protein
MGLIPVQTAARTREEVTTTKTFDQRSSRSCKLAAKQPLWDLPFHLKSPHKNAESSGRHQPACATNKLCSLPYSKLCSLLQSAVLCLFDRTDCWVRPAESILSHKQSASTVCCRAFLHTDYEWLVLVHGTADQVQCKPEVHIRPVTTFPHSLFSFFLTWLCSFNAARLTVKKNPNLCFCLKDIDIFSEGLG